MRFLLRNQSICNLVTILSLYSRLQYSYFLSRMLSNYIDLMASYLLREWSFIITEENLGFFAFMYVLLKNNIQVEFEYLHSVNLLCMRSFSINIEYINGTILQKSLFGIQGILRMVVWLNMKMVNPWLREVDI